MRKFRWITAAVALCSIFGFNAYMGGSNTTTASAETSDFPCLYAAGVKDDYIYYGSSAVVTYAAEEAATAGVPAGYEGQVLEVKPLSGSASCGLLLDFSEKDIPMSVVQSLEFRMYIPYNAANTGGRPQARIAQPFKGGDGWVYQPGSTPTPAGEWTTVIIEKNNYFTSLADESGDLYKFELSVRSNVAQSFYLDSVSVNLLPNDNVAPVISCNVADTVYVNEGAEWSVDATAYDAAEKRNVEVVQTWDKTPFDENGKLIYGTYRLTLSAQDYYGNKSEKTITLVVKEADNEAPVIDCDLTEIYATVGTIPVLKFTATDNSGVVNVMQSWSSGALDNRGALNAGTHTLTLAATDASGNKTTKTVTVYVTTEENWGDNVIDEEAMIPRFTVAFDGENAVQYKQGEKVVKPDDPTAPADNMKFIGWFVGETQWNFETDVVTADLNLVAKWEEVEDSSSSEDSSSDSEIKESSGKESSSMKVETSSKEESSSAAEPSKNCFGSISGLAVLPILLGAFIALKKKKE